MRKLMVAVVIGLGVLIMAGTMTIALTVAHRSMAVPPVPRDAVLDEPSGTRIAQILVVSDRLALRLEGGGPDRVVVVDLTTGKVAGRAVLAR